MIISVAFRGRYDKKNKTSQKLELRSDEIANAITTVQKRQPGFGWRK